LDNWIRVNNEAHESEKVLAKYLQLLQQHGIGKIDEHSERFFRLSIELVIESTLKSASSMATDESNPNMGQGKALNYNLVDGYNSL